VTNVDGCAGLKLLHLPTDELKVYSTIDRPTDSSFENLALCFAIYFASTVSLDDEEAQTILGQDKCAHLLSFKAGLEQAFAQGDFLDRPTLTGLHALAIYLVCSILCYHLSKPNLKLSPGGAPRPQPWQRDLDSERTCNPYGGVTWFAS